MKTEMNLAGNNNNVEVDYKVLGHKEVFNALNLIHIDGENIRSQKHVEAVFRGHMKKKNINRGAITIYEVPDMEVCEKTLGRFEVKSASTSRIITDKNIQDINIQNGVIVKKATRFSFDTISITVDQEAQSIFHIASNKISLVVSPNGKVKIYATGENNLGKVEILDLQTGKNVLFIPQEDGDKVYQYKSLAWTASNKRGLTVQAMLVNGPDGDTRFETLNRATSGGLGIFLDGAIDRIKEINTDEDMFKETLGIQQKFGYIGNCITGSKSFGNVKGFALYNGKWNNYIDEMELDDRYKAIKEEIRANLNNLNVEQAKTDELQAKLEALLSEKFAAETADGQAFGNATAIARGFEEETGICINPKYLVGMAVQCRPGNCKVMMTIVSESTFEALIDGSKKMAIRETAKEDKNPEDMFKVIGSDKLEDIMFLVDKNGMKLEHDFKQGLTLEVLALAKESASKTSSQMLTTLLGVEKTITEAKALEKSKIQMEKLKLKTEIDIEKARLKATTPISFILNTDGTEEVNEVEAIPEEPSSDLLVSLTKRLNELELIKEAKEESMDELIQKLVGETCNDKLSQIFDTSKRRVTMAEYMNSKKTSHYSDILNKAIPNWKLQSRGTFDTIVKQTTDSITNLFQKLRFDIEAHNRRLVPDPAFIISGGAIDGILNFGEVFINNTNIKNICMVKYPKMGIYEYYTASNVSFNAIKARTKKLVDSDTITLLESVAINNFYKSLSTSLAVLPASMLITHCCAGLDFDWDGACFIEQVKNPKTAVQEATNKIMDKVLSVKPLAVKF